MAKKRFDMSPAQLDEVLDACKPTPVMYLSGGIPMFNTPQENANHAWEKLGESLGFDPYSVEPIVGAPQGAFMAEPS